MKKGKKYRRFKHPSGTCWAAHQADALDTYLYSLSTLLSYLNNQISNPHNATMKKEAMQLEGVLNQCNKLSLLNQQQ